MDSTDRVDTLQDKGPGDNNDKTQGRARVLATSSQMAAGDVHRNPGLAQALDGG